MTTTFIDMAPAPWMAEGACRHEDPELFFPISASEANAGQIDRARAICEGCHVRAECLRYALANRLTYGIWGGRTEQQRQSMIRTRRRPRLQMRSEP
jgi:WhiB family redox-sensing transcriptional regulator